MRTKFSSMWRAVIALVMVVTLGLVMAAPAVADVEDVTVVPLSRVAEATTKYTITMTTTVALVENVDIISIVFPTGISPSTGDAAATTDVTVDGTQLDAVGDYNVTGQRVEITVPANVTAREFDVVIGVSGTQVTNPVAGSYTLDVYTSKETTAVTSEAFIIGGSATCKAVVASVVLSPYTVGVASQYTIEITLDAALTADTDTITITFPDGTTVPASITSASDVTIEGNALDATTDYSAVGQVVTLTVPEIVATGAGNCTVVFLVGADIINPTTVSTPTLTAHTTQEPIESAERSYASALVAGAITKAVFSVFPVPAEYDTATTITLETQDQYDNAKAVSASKTWVLTTTNTETGEFGTATVVISSGSSATFTYKDTVSGATVTAYESPSEGWTDATGTFTINPQVALYHDGVLVANFNTIQAAIDAAVPGDTIKAGAGTYTEDLSITKHDLTLESTAGAATTFIEGRISLSAAADNFVLGGAAGKGFTLSEDTKLISLTGPTDVEISYNTLDTGDGNTASNGIFIETAGATGLTVTENAFLVTDQYDMGIRNPYDGTDVVGLTVSNNTFTGTDNTLETSAVEILCIDISATDSVITGNTFTSVGNGVLIGSDQSGTGLESDADPAKLEISSNTFSGCNYGIDLVNATETGDVHNVVIKLNTFSNNTYGFAINYGSFPNATDKWQPEDFTVRYNDFSGNTYGIYNAADDTDPDLTAKHNYWGSPTGPSITATNPSGTGDAVSAEVDYSPWLSAGQASVIASGKSQYATSVMLSNVATLSGTTYSGGWNTFSTPIWLDGSADEWGEILSLANASLEVVNAYGWDGTTWTLVQTTDAVTPLDAIFVQLKTVQSLPILYSTQLLPAPTKTMHATAGLYTGWELVGQANLSAQETSVTLASIVNKYSQVIDPISGVVHVDATDMVVGAGYWVFMTADGTLAGFTTTPVAWVAVP